RPITYSRPVQRHGHSMVRLSLCLANGVASPVARLALEGVTNSRLAWADVYRSLDQDIGWELNILLADPADRGHGFGSRVQRLAGEYLSAHRESSSIFEFTLLANEAERRALLKAGFIDHGGLPQARYPVTLPDDPCVLSVWPERGRQ